MVLALVLVMTIVVPFVMPIVMLVRERSASCGYKSAERN
jgi:hypothetical protein